MADTNISAKDAQGQTKLILAKQNSDGSHSFYHVEDVTQRAALLAALGGLATSTQQAAANSALATIANNTAKPAPVNFSGSLSAPGDSNSVVVRGDFNFSLHGDFIGAYIVVERSFNGSLWMPLTAIGQSVVFSAPSTEIFSEPQANVRYRISVRELASGTVNFIISQ